MSPRQGGKIRTGPKETFGSNGYAHGPDRGHDLTGVYKCQNIKLCTLNVFGLWYIKKAVKNEVKRRPPNGETVVSKAWPLLRIFDRDRYSYTLSIHSVCLKVRWERYWSEVIITGSEEWAKLTACYLMGNNAKLLCNWKASDTCVGFERNDLTGQNIDEENISWAVKSIVHHDCQNRMIEKYDFRLHYLEEGRRLFCSLSELFIQLEKGVSFWWITGIFK